MGSKSIIVDIRPTLTYLFEHVKDSYSLFSATIYVKRYTKKEIQFHELFSKSDEIKRKLEEKCKVVILKSKDTKDLNQNIVTSYFQENNISFELIDYDEYIKTISSDLIVVNQPKKQMTNNFSPKYSCFGECSEIIPNLYLSGVECLPVFLKKKEITNVMSVLKTYMPTLDESYNHMKIEIHDEANQQIEKYFNEAHRFIDDAIEKNQKVLIHCYAGISRSATIVISYLMKKNKITFEKAYEMVKKTRSCISPNLSFYVALKEYEKTIL
jgi:protein-tyrosine phosphatase